MGISPRRTKNVVIEVNIITQSERNIRLVHSSLSSAKHSGYEAKCAYCSLLELSIGQQDAERFD